MSDSYHRTPGDTSEGRFLTILFSLFGCLLCAASLFVYFKHRDKTAWLIVLTVLDVVYTYIEIHHLYARKYWFRYHRRLAAALSLLIYWILIFALSVSINSVVLRLSFTWQLAWIPCFLMPPALVVILFAFGLLYVIGG